MLLLMLCGCLGEVMLSVLLYCILGDLCWVLGGW